MPIPPVDQHLPATGHFDAPRQTDEFRPLAAAPALGGVTAHMHTQVYRYHQYQGHTNDCGPTSLAIVANALLGEERFQGPRVAREMARLAFEVRPLPHLVVRRIPNWATFPWGIAHYLRQHGIPARWRPFGTLEGLHRNLLADRITIVTIGEPLRRRKLRYTGWAHTKVLFGHTPGEGFLFVDPAHSQSPDDSDSWKRNCLSWQEESEFLRQWRNLFRITIEVG